MFYLRKLICRTENAVAPENPGAPKEDARTTVAQNAQPEISFASLSPEPAREVSIASILENEYPELAGIDKDLKLPDVIPEVPTLQTWTLWGKSFPDLMSSPDGRYYFKVYLKKEHSANNLIFWEYVEIFKVETKEERYRNLAKLIKTHFISSDSRLQINLSNVAKKSVEGDWKTAGRDFFDVAQHEIFVLMKKDSYFRFLGSEYFLDLSKKKSDQD